MAGSKAVALLMAIGLQLLSFAPKADKPLTCGAAGQLLGIGIIASILLKDD